MTSRQHHITINEGPSGWGIAFFLLVIIFFQKECEDTITDFSSNKPSSQSVVKPDQDAIPIPAFQESAPKYNGRRIKVGPCRSYRCKPTDKRSWITDEQQSDFVLAESASGFPDQTVLFYATGVPVLKWTSDNKQVWVLNEVKTIPL